MLSSFANRPNWDQKLSHPQASVSPLLVPGGGAHSLAEEGVGSSSDEGTDILAAKSVNR